MSRTSHQMENRCERGEEIFFTSAENILLSFCIVNTCAGSCSSSRVSVGMIRELELELGLEG